MQSSTKICHNCNRSNTIGSDNKCSVCVRESKRCPNCHRSNTVGTDNKCVQCVSAYISAQKSGYSCSDITAAIRRYGNRASFGGGHMIDGWELARETMADEKILRAMDWW